MLEPQPAPRAQLDSSVWIQLIQWLVHLENTASRGRSVFHRICRLDFKLMKYFLLSGQKIYLYLKFAGVTWYFEQMQLITDAQSKSTFVVVYKIGNIPLFLFTGHACVFYHTDYIMYHLSSWILLQC